MPNKKRMTAFYCRECGYESSRWVGQCPACHAWNTMVEAPVRESGGTARTIARGGTARAGIGLSEAPWFLSEATPALESRRSFCR